MCSRSRECLIYHYSVAAVYKPGFYSSLVVVRQIFIQSLFIKDLLCAGPCLTYRSCNSPLNSPITENKPSRKYIMSGHEKIILPALFGERNVGGATVLGEGKPLP